MLIFPDMIRYRRLTHFDVETFVEEVLVKMVNGCLEVLNRLQDRTFLCVLMVPGINDAAFVGLRFHGKVTGHWYGYVMPDDVPMLIEQHIEKGEIVDGLWRGQMGLSEEDQLKAQEQRVIANGDGNMERSIEDGSQVADGGCCQANGGSACCQASNPPENAVNFNLEMKTNGEKKKGIKNQISINIGNKGATAPHSLHHANMARDMGE
ncbi:hypothetical protein L1987_02467 [Smallanthus sonchifolius]|uniref:Uncharacterized protein n=1 Tax=Smallanthus sonchifolius TaxID=185202 RepID=A0ACB9K7W5_9ASTR|nr:hypothetical protein L1987_02467 [Smallanthus sonchifolius]